jgi:AraC family transcriptional regulator of adaptative response/methylated-DNA-[protein]-cysteine methyltransferase
VKLTPEIMYDAMLRRDSSFEGIFYTAVRTTGIFCRPTCTARKPKFENVEFFHSTRDAILHGYRPCKVCKPLEPAGNMPASVKSLLDELTLDPSLILNDADLTKRGVQPEFVRRWFKKYHGITFHAYQRMMRINSAFGKLKSGERVTDVAFDAGYESLSGFTDAFKSTLGISPSESGETAVINIIRFNSPLGSMFACATCEGVCLLEFTDRKMLETELRTLTKALKGSIIHGRNSHLDLLEKEIMEYFEGKRKEFSVKLQTPGTPFQKEVWEELVRIPYGKTRSYKEQALALNRPGAVRAVANANGMNRIAIVVPCHRVIGDDGHLTGYGGGIWRKKWLLDFERSSSGITGDAQQAFAFDLN